MEKITYYNSFGDTLTFDSYSEIILNDFKGFGSADINPATNSGYKQNGFSVSGVYLGSRIININLLLFGSVYEKKRKLDKLFNPLFGEGYLVYENDYQKKMITCYPTALPEISKRDGALHFVEVELTAFNPFFTDVSDNAALMEDFIGGLHFPIAKTQVHFATKGDVSTINNVGDVETPLKVEFRGVAVNPSIKLMNTNKYIKVNTTIAEDEKLIINTEYGNKTVIKIDSNGNQTSAYNLIDINSTFFDLPIGENKLSFDSVSGSPTVYIYYKNRYLGV